MEVFIQTVLKLIVRPQLKNNYNNKIQEYHFTLSVRNYFFLVFFCLFFFK